MNQTRYFKLVMILILSFLLISCQSYSDKTNPSDYLSFELKEDGTYEVTGFERKPVKELVIPGTYQNTPVTSVGEYAFAMKYGIWGAKRNLAIEKVTIEEGVVEIKSYAFHDAGIKEVVLPSSLEAIGDYAFADNMTSIQIPENIHFIGEYALKGTLLSGQIDLSNILAEEGAFSSTLVESLRFDQAYFEIPSYICMGCSELLSIELPETDISIGNGSFLDCTKLETVKHIDRIIEIQDYSFSNTGLKTVEFGEKLTAIGAYAFYSSLNLHSIQFPIQPLEIGQRAFGKLLLNNVVFGDSDNYALAFLESKIDIIEVHELSHYTVIQGSLSKISNYQKKLILAKNDFTEIEDFNILGSYSLAFHEFDQLIIPNTVDLIKSNVFYFSTINDLLLEAKQISSESFHYVNILNLEVSTEVIPSYGFSKISLLESLVLLEGVKMVQSNAFCCLYELKSIDLPSSLEKIDVAGFLQCPSITDIYYYVLTDSPAQLNNASFVEYISNRQNESGKIDAKLPEDLKMHVFYEMEESCLNAWKSINSDHRFDYHSSLEERVIADIKS